MKVSVAVANPLQFPCQALIVGCFEDEGHQSPFLAELDKLFNGVIEVLYARSDFSGKLLSSRILYSMQAIPAERVILVGLGKREELTPGKLRQAAGAAVQAAGACNLSAVASVLHVPGALGGIPAETVLEGAFLGNYSFTRYQKKGKESQNLEELIIVCSSAEVASEIEAAATVAKTICDSALFARDLVSQPANVATPSYLAEEAQEVADGCGISCTIIEREEMEKLGMDALVAVAKGSQEAPKLIVMEYLPLQGSPPVVLIGKGVTFDSGGISLKPREGMEKMKNDMAGGAAVIASLQAVARLGLPVNVVGIVPAVENLPGGRAYKPGDLITSMSGQTIEIVNTDAEGRLILCDTLHYAQRYNPEAIIDIATLTGACVVALGTVMSGLMGNDDRLKEELKSAGESVGEQVWELPLNDEYGELMKSDVADMKNAGGPTAGTISAAWFLKQFVAKTPWAHIDIAGTAWEEKGKPCQPKGATGVGVRLLVEFLRNRVNR